MEHRGAQGSSGQSPSKAPFALPTGAASETATCCQQQCPSPLLDGMGWDCVALDWVGLHWIALDWIGLDPSSAVLSLTGIRESSCCLYALREGATIGTVHSPLGPTTTPGYCGAGWTLVDSPGQSA